ncbi:MULTISPECIES: flagellar assembly peptidoglycan hydrolase FlgJ [Xanthomonas]|uniref:Peptidoglycan hydrolase FlgJ n=1 Tax=Xanthomonas rydalmerensis TaxID=3046274 RepID=A0ABZ0JGP8_9XANT|nr:MULTISPECIES: flagellar assembly peptidoglycan hydrolase FlgJ [unclassified Xanthomonas]MBB5876395.1 flagellar protein FlgJ [Xanthomonas sp. 3498]MBB5944148.1 flagellar protein FlgJ [Xanthomonas sp. 3307]MXV07396.1 flagellar assembly peptidoglycan hydrolase FlgJ [Xanthomonas sp. LMG 9002]WOS38936.1 flagellar assembly peptidoglycan hydrolase FlgJ [Xanthomonas sp. DM-2023]WOS43117.1 flagellar assembly peptidoglycan hydrolase FlgJ [Xanthomonas sp. DM-2023]
MRISAAPFDLHASTQNDPAKIEKVSRQLEGQFANMLVKSMRDASFGNSLFPGENQTFRDMYDQQLAKGLTDGKGLGLAAMISKQLGGGQSAAATPTNTSLDAAKAAKAYSLVSGQSGNGPMPLQGDAALAAGATAGAGVGPWSGAEATASPQQQVLDMIAGRESSAMHQAIGSSPADGSAGMSWAGADDRWSNVQATADSGNAIDPSAAAAANAAAASLGERTPEGFVAKIWNHAQKAAQELGVDARALVAQAALETGWGRRGISRGDGASSNNLFGIKATGWNGDRVTTGTHEYVDGVKQSQTADFRAYSSPAESFADYVRLLKTNPRYQQALKAGTDIRGFAQGLQRAGYATDPAYAAKIAAIAGGPTIGRAVAAIGSAAAGGIERVLASTVDSSGLVRR